MKALHRKRLLNVAKALIDEARWRKRNPPRGPEDGFTMQRFVNPCGSPACALGTYGARRDLQRAFKYRGRGRRAFLAYNNGRRLWLDDTGNPIGKHFGLTGTDVETLFETYGCNDAQTEHEAAAYIRAFVKRKEREARK